MKRRVSISEPEARIVQGYFSAIDSARRDLSIACGLILAREGITVAVVDDLEGNELVLTVPDEPTERGTAELGAESAPS